tara:strand:- start:148 stop:1329 length:1182 start_codon:yes stop_codon:yes gene_type:complete
MNDADQNQPLSFDRREYQERLSKAREVLKSEGVSAALLFAQETDYYLTGYDTSGFVFFQCFILDTKTDSLTLLTRRPDLVQARDTSIIDDIRIWWDADNANPALELRSILEEKQLAGKRIGIELATHGLTGFNHKRVVDALGDFCTLVDISWPVRRLRLCKTESELRYVRKAAQLCNQSLSDVISAAAPGIQDSTLNVAYLDAVLEGGGDMPVNPPLFNSGRRALYGRGVSGARLLGQDDQIVVEFPVSYRRYNVKTEWTIVLGKLNPKQYRMYEVARDALYQMTDVTRPGNPLGKIFEVHASVLDTAGYQDHRYGACGYSMGISCSPTSMDVPPMVYPHAALCCEPGMTLFYHVMITDTDSGYAMGVGHTLLVTENEPEILNPLPDELSVIG